MYLNGPFKKAFPHYSQNCFTPNHHQKNYFFVIRITTRELELKSMCFGKFNMGTYMVIVSK